MVNRFVILNGVLNTHVFVGKSTNYQSIVLRKTKNTAEQTTPPPRSQNRQPNPLTAFIHAVFDQVVDHRRVSQCRGVAERAIVVFGDFAQDPAHYFA